MILTLSTAGQSISPEARRGGFLLPHRSFNEQAPVMVIANSQSEFCGKPIMPSRSRKVSAARKSPKSRRSPTAASSPRTFWASVLSEQTALNALVSNDISNREGPNTWQVMPRLAGPLPITGDSPNRFYLRSLGLGKRKLRQDWRTKGPSLFGNITCARMLTS